MHLAEDVLPTQGLVFIWDKIYFKIVHCIVCGQELEVEFSFENDK